ncbi:MAG: cysteine dioxygenase family protein [Polaribacter sp.]|uniref:cysteine dioxygenase n=1 Tax=Polaribacter sp. TaxID=1920175 RepID=UPI002F356C6D
MNSNEHTSQTLQSLDELISALSEGERTTYNHIIHSLKLPTNAFEKYSSWSDECYTRNCIANNDKFELILICWCKGHRTSIHDHGGEECWVKVIEGEFKETIFKKDEIGALNLVKSTISKLNEITYMKDFMGFHRLENVSNKKSMSLHLYAKPIRKCNIFDEKLKIFVNKDLTYNTTA